MAYQLEKWVWTEADFDQMGWHDATIYAVQFGKDISFDIDYIFEWVQADEDDFFAFQIAPATLVFPAPRSVVFSIDFSYGGMLTIEHVHRRTTDAGATEWCLETHQGDITITTEAFRQVIRRPLTLQTGQRISEEERGEPSFSLVPDAAFVASETVRQLQAADFALREKAVELRRQQRQMEILREQRGVGALELKPYLLAKRAMEERIETLRLELQKTDWAF